MYESIYSDISIKCNYIKLFCLIYGIEVTEFRISSDIILHCCVNGNLFNNIKPMDFYLNCSLNCNKQVAFKIATYLTCYD